MKYFHNLNGTEPLKKFKKNFLEWVVALGQFGVKVPALVL
jgi:hypothetical protein